MLELRLHASEIGTVLSSFLAYNMLLDQLQCMLYISTALRILGSTIHTSGLAIVRDLGFGARATKTVDIHFNPIQCTKLRSESA